MRCLNCNQPANIWAADVTTSLRHETFQAIQQDQHMVMEIVNNEWSFRWVNDDELNDDMILVDDLEQDVYTRPTQLLRSNVQLIQMMNNLFL